MPATVHFPPIPTCSQRLRILLRPASRTLEPEGQGFRISRSALTLRAQVPNLDEATFARLAGEAEKNCPISKVLNAAITLDAKLI